MTPPAPPARETGGAAPRVAVLGGGTAGWMAACLMLHAWPRANVTVIESPAIGIVGVGEGSTPQLRALFATLGIDEARWMPAADATYKLGIAFAGWAGPGSRYFHPFASDVDVHTQGQFHHSTLMRRRGHDVPAHPDRFFLNARLAAAGCGPQPVESFPFAPGYGYHFDAHKVGAVLRDEALSRRAGHLTREVTQVDVRDGQVAALVLDTGERVEADIFVDASGFRTLIAGALDVPFVGFGDNLFCDAAVTIPTPRAPDRLDPFTTATALDHGWVWRIPLTGRTGNGYVYSTRYCSPDDAEAELRRHLGVGDEATARHLTMRVGRLATTWTGNCLAVGLAQGFIEPLEATALHLTQVTIEGFIESWPAGGFTPQHRAAFNARIARRFEGVRDYIVAHYRLNARGDTPFWRDNAAHDALSDDLRAILAAWFAGGDVAEVLHARDLARYYSPLSWEALLAGYGAFPSRLAPATDRVDLPALDRLLDRCALNFGDHAAQLERLC